MVQGLSLLIPLFAASDAASQPTSAPSTQAATPPPATQPWTDHLADLLGPTFRNTTWVGWITLLVGIAGGFAASRIVTAVLRTVSDRLSHRGWKAWASIIEYAMGPTRLAAFTFGLTIGVQGLSSPPEVRDTLHRFIGLLYIVAIGWFLFNLVDLLDLVLRRFTAKQGISHLDETLLVILRKTLRVFLMVLFALFIAQNTFGANITTWLAGLGIAGLAVSLAAQDSVKNLFGSVTVLLDRPFSLGDRIIFGAYDGTVEAIGFRSTKIRTVTGNLVTVPNMKFTDSVVENIGTRPWVRRSMNITITYDTSPDKVEQAVNIVRGILEQPDIAKDLQVPGRPPRVYFNEFNADSLNIMVNYWYPINVDGRDWWSYQSHAEQINQQILIAFGEAGIEFAFPTQTVYVADDPKRRPTFQVEMPTGPADRQ